MSYHRDLQRFAARDVYQIQDTLYEAIPCTYCGMPASDDEHVLPRTYVSRFHDIPGVIPFNLAVVPACRECNRLAGKAVLKGVQDKRAYIHEKLKQRYRKVLEIPQWTEVELSELSPDLAQYVRQGLKQKAIILSRLRWQRGSNLASNVGGCTFPKESHKNSARQHAARLFTTQKSTKSSRASGWLQRCERPGCASVYYTYCAVKRFCSKECKMLMRYEPRRIKKTM